MIEFLKKVFRFRVGQRLSRRAARMFGLGAVSSIIGLVGGWRYMRRHTPAT